MKSRFVLITVFVVSVTIFAMGRRPAQAAHLSTGHVDKAPAISYLPQGDTVTMPQTDIPVDAIQIEPSDPNAGRNWALNMLVAFIGLSAGSIVLNYLWMRGSRLNRTR